MTRCCRANTPPARRSRCASRRGSSVGQARATRSFRPASGSPRRSSNWGPRRSSSASSWPRAPISSAPTSRAASKRSRTACRRSRKPRRAASSKRNLAGRSARCSPSFGPPVAAASIAQVHQAETADDPPRRVAVKILRPGIEAQFARDFRAFRLGGRASPSGSPPKRGACASSTLVDTLARSVALELDLRMEGAAAAELAENMRDDAQFRVPALDWSRTSARVLDHRVDRGHAACAIPKRCAPPGTIPSDRRRRCSARSSRRRCATDFSTPIMHPGNLFVDKRGTHLRGRFRHHGPARSRRCAASWPRRLGGFLARDYVRVAQVHFDVGFVPQDPQCRDLRAGAARRRRADLRPDRARGLDGAAAGTALRDHAPLRHAASAAARAAAEDHDGGRGPCALARSRIRHLGSLAPGDRKLDGRSSRPRGAAARCGRGARQSRPCSRRTFRSSCAIPS